MTESWTSLKLIQWTSGYFERKGIPNPRVDAELLLAHVLECQRIALYTDHEKVISEKLLAKFKSLLERRAKREPLQYILGETEFWGLKFKVTPDVLIPRPETELLVEEALKFKDSKSILDIGTGSGCIAVSLAKHLPETKLVATDISKEALEVARENAETHALADRIEFVLADIAPWRVFQSEGRTFDLIVSNPPYIDEREMNSLQPEVRDFEPRGALVAGRGGLEIVEKILAEAMTFLRPEGLLLLEVGEGQAEKLRDRTCKILEVKKDYQGAERIVILKKVGE